MKAKKSSVLNIEWRPLIGVALILAVIAVLAYLIFSLPTQVEADLGLSSEAKQAYTEALELAAVYENPEAAIRRLNMVLSELPSVNKTPNELYTQAKLLIYQADIYLTYGFEYERGFKLLSVVLDEGSFDNDVRAEALLVSMAHAFQALDEGALSVTDVRDYIFLNGKYREILGIGVADAMLLDKPADAYPYLVRGFSAAASITSSEKILALAESYSLRLSAPFVIPPPTGGYYYNFVASLGSAESRLDALFAEYASQNVPYQEFIATAYYNLARAYEALPPGEVNVVENMDRIYAKLSGYIADHADVALGASEYLSSLDVRTVCRAVDDANFDAANIDTARLQPHLDRLIEGEGWVVPCEEAFTLIADEIDPRFAEYF